MRPWPDSVAGRTLLLLVGMTAVMVIGAAWLLHDERSERFDERNRTHFVERVSTLVRVLDDADDAERQRIIGRLPHPEDHISLSAEPMISPQEDIRTVERMFERKLRRALNRRAVHVRMDFEQEDQGMRRRGHHDDDEDDDHDEPYEHHGRHRGHDAGFDRAQAHELRAIQISVMLRDGTWLNIETRDIAAPPPWAGKTLQLLGLLLLLSIISGLIIARRMASPMQRLGEAAERFGLGQTQEPLAETGPREVRHAIRAFNRMQERLHKHITDRSQMLAAVSHDLRTPITALRLRAEYIDDEEMREKTLATLTEMEAMLAATLSFARDEAADEQTRSTDLAALVQSVVDDHADLGGEVSYHGPEKLVMDCRPVALRRAINNVIENGLKYGQRARVSVLESKDEITIQVDDQGPGIPQERMKDVLEPFVRLESSRSRDTGGTGLGLSLARSVMLAHGGEIRLMNRTEGGLRCELRLVRYY